MLKLDNNFTNHGGNWALSLMNLLTTIIRIIVPVGRPIHDIATTVWGSKNEKRKTY